MRPLRSERGRRRKDWRECLTGFLGVYRYGGLRFCFTAIPCRYNFYVRDYLLHIIDQRSSDNVLHISRLGLVTLSFIRIAIRGTRVSKPTFVVKSDQVSFMSKVFAFVYYNIYIINSFPQKTSTFSGPWNISIKDHPTFLQHIELVQHTEIWQP